MNEFFALLFLYNIAYSSKNNKNKIFVMPKLSLKRATGKANDSNRQRHESTEEDEINENRNEFN